MTENRAKLSNKLLTLGIALFFMGFVFLSLVRKEYAGFFSFISPLFIVGGIIVIGVSLAL